MRTRVVRGLAVSPALLLLLVLGAPLLAKPGGGPAPAPAPAPEAAPGSAPESRPESSVPPEPDPARSEGKDPKDAGELKALSERIAELERRMESLRRDAQRRSEAQSAEARKKLGELGLQTEVLSEEVRRLRERLVLPETDEQKSVFGLGPSASKVYQLQQSGLSIGGYGEFFVDRKVKDITAGKDFSTGNVYRFVQYLGYKFTDRLVMNAEIEFEHATTGSNYEGRSGAVSVEFLYMDALLHAAANLRFGLMLVPMGFINELHEPTLYHGNLRPEVERQILPSTWRELGMMVFGSVGGFAYKAWAMNGLNAEKFSPSGWREGRQKGGRVLTEDWGGGLRLEYNWKDILFFSTSLFYGGADHGRISLDGEQVTARTLLVEAHAQFRFKGIEFRALGAFASMSGARDLTLALYPHSLDPDSPETRLLAGKMYGYYVEAAYDLWRLFGARRTMYLAPFVRLENFNTQASTPSIAGRQADRRQNQFILDVGLTFRPHHQVVLKINYRDMWNEARAKKADALIFGAGFVY